jgi:hypothetical protein
VTPEGLVAVEVFGALLPPKFHAKVAPAVVPVFVNENVFPVKHMFGDGVNVEVGIGLIVAVTATRGPVHPPTVQST